MTDSLSKSRASEAASLPRGDSASRASMLGRELGGDLQCAACGYNLKGISIRRVCPECGVAVRATILSLVDPLASEIQPIRSKRVVAAGLMLWGIGAVGAAVVVWIPMLMVAAAQAGIRAGGLPALGVAIQSLLGVSCLGSVVLIRPHAGIKRAHQLMAMSGTLLYLVLIAMVWQIEWVIGTGSTRDHLWRGAFMATCCVMILLIRPNARLMVARSLVMRQGRVDRQTLFGMAGAALVAAIGHLLAMTPALMEWNPTGSSSGLMTMFGKTLIVLGVGLLTIGLFGGLIDLVRISRAVLMPSPSIREVLRRADGSTAGPRGEG